MSCRHFVLAFAALLFGFSTGAGAQVKAPSMPQSAGSLGDTMAVTSVRVVVGHPDLGTTLQRLAAGKRPAAISAVFTAQGGGTVSGHWELMTPADGSPHAADITPAPQLAPAARATQRRFRQLDTFSFSLAPGDRYVLPGPAIASKDLVTAGRYHVLLRIDSATSYNGTSARLPARIAPVVLEVDMPRPAPGASETKGG